MLSKRQKLRRRQASFDRIDCAVLQLENPDVEIQSVGGRTTSGSSIDGHNSSTSQIQSLSDGDSSEISVSETDCSSQEAVNDKNLSSDDKIEQALIEYIQDENTPSGASVARLLKSFNKHFPWVPLTAETLLGRHQREFQIEDMHHGRYVHIKNWKRCVVEDLQNVDYRSITSLHALINVDGIPLFNDSRRFHAYPILIKFEELQRKIFVIGMYVSENTSNKMPPVHVFLKKCVDELILLEKEGLQCTNQKVTVTIKAIVCDAPARAELKNTVNHNSYYACERCIQKGTYSQAGGHVVLESTTSELRTDTSFREKIHQNHHKPSAESSPLLDLKLDMVLSFPLDYMHGCCLGVMRRLLHRWKSSKRNELKCHLDVHSKNEFDNRIESFASCLPSEFSRKMVGGMKTLSYWKAVEYRVFLIYAGVYVLRNVIPEAYYNHFLGFCVAMRILLTPNQYENMPVVRHMLTDFVEESKTLYGPGFVSFNVHNLIHLADDYERFGALDLISCFSFETYLGSKIKGCLHGRNRVLEQITKSVLRTNCLLPPKPLPNNEIVFGRINAKPKKSVEEICFKSVSLGHLMFKCSPVMSRDNGVILKNGEIGFITRITQNNIHVCNFGRKDAVFLMPTDSSNVGIFKVYNIANAKCVPISSIFGKTILLPCRKSVLALKMLN